MTIRSAAAADLTAILEIFDTARAFMRANGNLSQWPVGYPSREIILRDIADGTCYVCEQDGEIQGTFFYAEGDDPTYGYIYDGAWPDSEPYAVIHRVASAGRVPGVAVQIFRWAAARGMNLRMDTHDDNLPMQHVLEKNGFVRCGYILTDDGTPRIAYQRTAR